MAKITFINKYGIYLLAIYYLEYLAAKKTTPVRIGVVKDIRKSFSSIGVKVKPRRSSGLSSESALITNNRFLLNQIP